MQTQNERVEYRFHRPQRKQAWRLKAHAWALAERRLEAKQN
jgi:hypothetical protein